MQSKRLIKSIYLLTVLFLVLNPVAQAQGMMPSAFAFDTGKALCCLVIFLLILVIAAIINLNASLTGLKKGYGAGSKDNNLDSLRAYTRNMGKEQLRKLLHHKSKKAFTITATLLILSQLIQQPAIAQETGSPGTASLLGESGIIITILLIGIPILIGMLIMIMRIRNLISQEKHQQKIMEAEKLSRFLATMPEEELAALKKRNTALEYALSGKELAGDQVPEDRLGLLQIHDTRGLPVVARKKKALPRPNIDPGLSKLILWYIGSAAFWLLFGTTIGEYLGIKFIAPDADHISWLSFGRLRPVHTNAVFWGWASLGMLGLGYYVVPRVSNAALASIKWGWYSLWLINAAVILGTLSLMAGINNGGGEYREYTFPVMLLFAGGLLLTLVNYIKTIARRKTEEIYISNWYIVSAIIFLSIIATVGYLPFWQNGLGETIVQGYYMHQAVGMWFMLFTLGIVYYFLPQQLNKPIYSYSLGILAFWTQILFYTLIGTHHFVFSAIPWWLQTVAIVASAGMIIPVVAGTTNFLMTFKGSWFTLGSSYTMPFFLVGIIFYFTGSLQGTAEAFRFTNLLWHFTDFTVAHSHLTMYGIISFLLWAGMYALIPRLTGKEAPQITIGIHFWLALIGLMFYTLPLMYGGTLRGLSWMEGKPFVESIQLMMPFWLWRAIGGTLMWLSHLFFAYNFYRMVSPAPESMEIGDIAITRLEENQSQTERFAHTELPSPKTSAI